MNERFGDLGIKAVTGSHARKAMLHKQSPHLHKSLSSADYQFANGANSHL